MRRVVAVGCTHAPFGQGLRESRRRMRQTNTCYRLKISITFFAVGPKIRLAATKRSLERSHAADCGLARKAWAWGIRAAVCREWDRCRCPSRSEGRGLR